MKTIHRRIQKLELEGQAQATFQIDARRLLTERLDTIRQIVEVARKRGDPLPVVEVADVQARLNALVESLPSCGQGGSRALQDGA